jgi:hypothetical protein
MNERIRLLAQQATVLDYSTWDSYNQKTHDHYKFDKEKFAELIVRECMTQIQRVREIVARQAESVPYTRGSVSYPQGFDDGMFVAIRTIEEDFGVGE